MPTLLEVSEPAMSPAPFERSVTAVAGLRHSRSGSHMSHGSPPARQGPRQQQRSHPEHLTSAHPHETLHLPSAWTWTPAYLPDTGSSLSDIFLARL